MSRLMAISIVFLCLVTFQLFANHIGNSPYLAVDDALAVISHSIAASGRFGHMSDPLQVGLEALRTDNFFNYGPWYFYVGAFFSWIFGTSLEVQRAIHPIGLYFTILVAFLTFRTYSIAATGVFAAVLMYLFFHVHWPMVRPDIMIAVFGALTIAFSTRALISGGIIWWFLTAASAMGAITQHQVSGALGPTVLLIWAIWAVVERREENTSINILMSFAACGMGVVIVGLGYLDAIGFRVLDLFNHFSFYAKNVSNTDLQGGYFSVLKEHFNFAWGNVNVWIRIPLLVGLVLSGLLLILIPYFPKSIRRVSFGLLLPPVSVSLAYQLSLGFYGNWHLGYVLLSHVSTIWAATAVLTVLIHYAGECKRPRKTYDVTLALVVLTAIFYESYYFQKYPSHLQTASRNWVNIGDYIDRVLAPLPPRASGWGSVTFGMEMGSRADIVQLSDALILSSYIKPEFRRKLAPNYLVFGNFEQNFGAIEILLDHKEIKEFRKFTKVLNDVDYELIHLVNAPPYGTSRVYRIRDEMKKGSPLRPTLMVNDGRSPQWSSRIKPAISANFISADRVSLEFSPQEKTEGGIVKTSRAKVSSIEAGTYLIEARINRKGYSGSSPGVLIATDTKEFVGQFDGLDYGFDVTPYFPWEETVYMLINHKGGALFISQFDENSSADFKINSVRPVEVFQPHFSSLPLPHPTLWQPGDNDVDVIRSGNEVVTVRGNNSLFGYQLISPPIVVEEEGILRLDLPLEIESGTLSVGILDSTGDWLKSPSPANTEFDFFTGDTTSIRIVIANSKDDAEKVSRFSLGTGKLRRVGASANITYSDRISICHPSRKKVNSELCL